MTDLILFGPMIGSDEVEAAVEATLKLWLPTYLAELERRTGRDAGTLPLPKSWSTVNAFSQDQRDQLPAAIIVSRGTSSEPQRRGDGSYDVMWDVSVAIIVTSTSRQGANALAKLYAKAVRAVMLQRPALGGIASSVYWAGEANGSVPTDYLPIGWATESAFSIDVRGVVTALAGPPAPDLDPTDLAEVATAHIALERTT